MLNRTLKYRTSGIRTNRVSNKKFYNRVADTMRICLAQGPWNFRIPGLFPQNPEELSGIANTADLLYTYHSPTG